MLVSSARLRGRQDVMAALAKSAQAALEGGLPRLFTLVGGDGLGKTRLAVEAAALARRIRTDAVVISLRAASPLEDGVETTAQELLARLLDLDGVTAPSDLAASCEAELGSTLSTQVRAAAASTLGWTTMPVDDQARARIQNGAKHAILYALRSRAQAQPLAVLLDDAHRADDTVLDALELATRCADGARLWIVMAAHPQLLAVRRRWGWGAEHHDTATLRPLDDEAAINLAAELFLPAEELPRHVLVHVAESAQHNPLYLAELVQSLKQAGVVCRQDNGKFGIATAEIPKPLPTSSPSRWIAAERLQALQPRLAACLRSAAIAGPEATVDEIEQAAEALGETGGAEVLDAASCLSALTTLGVLERRASGRFIFRSAWLREAIVELFDPLRAREAHAQLQDRERASSGAGHTERYPLERLAFHAMGCNARDRASRIYRTLGEAAAGRRRFSEAVRHFTAALEAAPDGDTRARAEALAGRGKAERRGNRLEEALEDLREAREAARLVGDELLTAEVLLEEAAALDWMGDVVRAVQRTEEARPIVERTGDPRLVGAWLTAHGRALVREGRAAEAIQVLERAASAADVFGESVTRAQAGLELARVLVVEGRVDEAEAGLVELLRALEDEGNRSLMGAAYAARARLRQAQGLPGEAAADLRRAVRLAVNTGDTALERVLMIELAALLHGADQGSTESIRLTSA